MHKISMVELRQGWAAHPEQPQGRGQQPGQQATALEVGVRVRNRVRIRVRKRVGG